MMTLSKRERRLAEISVKRYHSLFYKRSGLFEWVGVILFTVGLLKMSSLPQWSHHLFLYVGCTVLFLGTLGQLMGLVGKLYEEVQRLENHYGAKN